MGDLAAMTYSSIPHPLVRDNAARRHWAAARKAARQREDFCSALIDLGEAIDDIQGQFATARADLRELWRLIDEDAP